MRRTILGLFAVVSLCFGFTAGLKCYQCNYSGGDKPVNQDCNAKEIATKYLQTCPADTKFCIAVTGNQNVSNVIVPAVKRDCAPETYKKAECVNTTDYAGFEKNPIQTCCTCAEEGCNSKMYYNFAPKLGLAHFSLPLLGLALRQVSAIL